MTYIIRALNKQTGFITVEYDDKSMISFPLPVDPEGMVPEGAELTTFINQARPQVQPIKDIKNIEVIEALVQPAPPPIPTWDHIRSLRNMMLSESDWTVLSDVPMAEPLKTAWINYRQQLRDITITFANPADVVWPTPPA